VNHFQSLREYEDFIYDLSSSYPAIVASTLVIVRRSAKQATIVGEVVFADAYRLVVSEIVDFAEDRLVLRRYGYEVWHGTEKLYWYDPQPHPQFPELASTHPHHKHVPPDIKHHRIPAPGLSFTQPNLPFLIQEIEQILLHT
jgi:hypothetical protein